MAGEPRPPDEDLLRAVPGLARIAAGAWVRTTLWTLATSARAGERMLHAVVPGETAADVAGGLRDHARRLLGAKAAPEPGAAEASGPAARPPNASLRTRGAELLRRSADVRHEEHSHPAYERILGELAPDEARILRLLCVEGAQPAVDVRASRTLNVSSELVASGLSMIGALAGCRYVERVPAYLNNLYRLGLIWFSREALPDPLRYQVLEAQPDVLAAMRRQGRGRTVRRSIHLTPFGEDFCRICLPLEAPAGPAQPERGG